MNTATLIRLARRLSPIGIVLGLILLILALVDYYRDPAGKVLLAEAIDPLIMTMVMTFCYLKFRKS
ncbi:MAG: hypothetical protein K1V84_06750 [Muribaculaceae bacterium]